MTKQYFIEEFEKLSSDSERWKLLIKYEKEGEGDYLVNIDNDDVFITFKDNEETTILSFDEYGYYALEILLNQIGINAEMV